MRALLWKEARQALAPLLLALALQLVYLFDFGSVWPLLVDNHWVNRLNLELFPISFGLLFALWQFGRDHDERRLGQLLHRETGARGYFLSKATVGLVCTLASMTVPLTTWVLAMSLTDPDGGLIRWSRLGALVLSGAPALVAYACGALMVQLSRGRALLVGLGLLGGLGCWRLMLPSMYVPRAGVLHWPIVGMLEVAIVAILILRLAYGMLVAGRDRDLPIRDRHLIGLAALCLLVVFPAMSFVLGTVEDSAMQTVRDAKPTILHDTQTDEFLAAVETEIGWRMLDVRDGTVFGVTDIALHGIQYDFYSRGPRDTSTAQSPHLYLVHQARHSWTRSAQRLRSDWDEWIKTREWTARSPATGATSTGYSKWSWEEFLVLDAENGTIQLFASPNDLRGKHEFQPIHRTLVRTYGQFSTDAGFVPMRHASVVVLDPRDGSLWTVLLDTRGTRLERVEIPGGGRVLRFEPVVSRDNAVYGRFSEGNAEDPQIFTTTGTFLAKDLGLAPQREQDGDADTATDRYVPLDEAEKLVRYAVHVDWPDAFTEQVSIERLSDHQTVFALTAPPTSTSEQFCSNAYCALAFLRSPFAVFREFFFDFKTLAGRYTLPIVEGQRLFPHRDHAALFALLMLLAALQVWLAWRWLARSDAGLAVRITYAALILLCGPAALLLTWCLLPRRARVEPASRPVRAGAPLPQPA